MCPGSLPGHQVLFTMVQPCSTGSILAWALNCMSSILSSQPSLFIFSCHCPLKASAEKRKLKRKTLTAISFLSTCPIRASFENIYSVQYTVNKKKSDIQMHMFFSLQMFAPPNHLSQSIHPKKTHCCSCSHKPQPADPSAVNVNAGEQLLQGFQFLIGLLDGAVSLHVACDVIADLVHQRDGVGLVSLL